MGLRLTQPHNPARCPTQATAASPLFPLWQHYELRRRSRSDRFTDPSENYLCKTTQTALLSAPAAAAGLSAWLQRCLQQQLGRLQQRQAANCRSGVAKSRTALDGRLSPRGYAPGRRSDKQAVLMLSTGTVQALHLVHPMVLEKPKWKHAQAAPKPLPTA